jgi:hypothetical protein
MFAAPALLLLTVIELSLVANCRADALPFPDLGALVPAGTADAFVKAVGMTADHRAYEPATPLGTNVGLSMGFEATIAKVPDDFKAALAALGSGGSSPPVLPMPRLHLHKGMGEKAGIGLSFLGYQGYLVYGANFHLAIHVPEEGPVWALRLNYSRAKLGYVTTHTWTPEILVSRALDFADPYIGVGYQSITGDLTYSPSANGFTAPPQTLQGKAGGALAFLGVQFRLNPTGLQITIEGDYSSGGVHTLGTKIGFRF